VGLLIQTEVRIHVLRSHRSALATVVGAALGIVLACTSGSNATGPGGGAQGITVSPESSAVRVGATTTLNAVAHNASGTPISATSFFWSSSDTAIATVSQSGVVAGRTVGAVQIAASSGGMSGVATVAVVGQPIAAVVVVPSNATLRVNTTLQLSDTVKNAAGAPVPDPVVTWSSDNASVATVDAAALVVAHALGTAHITATAGGVSGTCTITVSAVPIASIIITPRRPTVFVQQTAQLTVTAEDSAGNTLSGVQVVWQSASPGIASVSSSGLVTGVSPGTAVVRATAEGVTGADTVKVTQAPVSSVVLSPSTSSVFIGETEQLSAQVTNAAGQPIQGAGVAFSSANTAVATVNARGVVTGVRAGITTITGTSQGKSGTAAVAVFQVPVASVTVQPSDTTVPPTGRAQMRAVVVDSLGRAVSSPTLNWSSTPAGRVSQTGLVTPQRGDTGSAITVVASSGGKFGSATVNVSIPPPPAIASVTVQPADTTIPATQTAQMRVTVIDVTGHAVTNAAVTWSSGPAGRISANGLVTPQAADAGTAIVVGATSGGHSGSAVVNVSPAAVGSVIVQPVDTTISAGQTAQMRPVVTDVNGHVIALPSVTWSSAPAGRVSTTGLVTSLPIDAGTAISVLASSGGQSGSATITVVAAPVASVVVQPADTSITFPQSAQMRVVVTDANGNVITIPSIAWSSVPTGRVSSGGLVTPQATDTGMTIAVTATSGIVSGSAGVSVLAPQLPGFAPVTAAQTAQTPQPAPAAGSQPIVNTTRGVRR
jgi:uncharacterized protein YjdB